MTYRSGKASLNTNIFINAHHFISNVHNCITWWINFKRRYYILIMVVIALCSIQTENSAYPRNKMTLSCKIKIASLHFSWKLISLSKCTCIFDEMYTVNSIKKSYITIKIERKIMIIRLQMRKIRDSLYSSIFQILPFECEAIERFIPSFMLRNEEHL